MYLYCSQAVADPKLVRDKLPPPVSRNGCMSESIPKRRQKPSLLKAFAPGSSRLIDIKLGGMGDGSLFALFVLGSTLCGIFLDPRHSVLRAEKTMDH
jgi:hypothetical protein